MTSSCLRPSGGLLPVKGLVALLLVLAGFSACGGGESTTRPTASPAPPAARQGGASPLCADSFKQGHDRERAGEATPKAFLPSIRVCRSLEEWTAAARAFGVNLQGREPEFVDNTCRANAEVQDYKICRDAKAAVTPAGGGAGPGK